MSTTQQFVTARQLAEAPGLGRCELRQGEVVMMSPAGFEHGRITSRLTARLQAHAERLELGVVTGAETGFQIEHDPDTVRAPDIAFIRRQRIPATVPRGYFDGAPDLAVEVLSPGDRAGELLAKVRDWLRAGCQSVWVVDPESRTVSVYRGSKEVASYGVSEELTDEMLPEFRVSVGEIFAL